MKPTVGRIVHYKDQRQITNAAIITKVWTDTCVDLVLFESRPKPDLVVNFSAVSSACFGDALDQWNWPERI